MRIGQYLSLTAFYGVVVISGCADVDLDTGVVGKEVYHASVEAFGMDTKTSVDQGRNVIWLEDDRIAVFDGTGTGKAYEILSPGRSYGDFKVVHGAETDDESCFEGALVAIYPFTDDLSVKNAGGGKYTVSGVVFPQEQTYEENSFASGSFPMAAVSLSGDKGLSFNNIGGILKLAVKGSESVRRITVTAHGNIPLVGTAEVDLEMGDKPSLTLVSGSSVVSLVCTPAVQLSEDTPVCFMISVLPADLKEGLSVVVEDENGNEYVKSTTESNVIKRSTILSMPEFQTVSDGQEHEYVDLGLSVKWALCNVGASSPEEYGGYFAWGETEPKSSFTSQTYEFYDSRSDSYMDIGSEISGTEYDAATVNWGSPWRMPSKKDMEELIEECIWSETVMNGVTGCQIEGPNGNTIFLPYSGYISGKSLYFDDGYIEGSSSYIRSGTIGNNKRDAYILCSSGSAGEIMEFYWQRYWGMAIRPVMD